MDLIEKILKKSLREVARSIDAHPLLINLNNLKDSPILNSLQSMISRLTWVLVHLFTLSKRHCNLKALYQSSSIMSRTLSETTEALKKMLHETEAEEDRIRATAERVYAYLVAKKGELETDASVLSEAKSRQQEVADKARKASDSWEKLRNLFT